MLNKAFFAAWLICGMSLETFFDGGAPVVIVSALVCVACAAAMGRKEE